MSITVMKEVLESLEKYQVKRQDFDRFVNEIDMLRTAIVEAERHSGHCTCGEPLELNVVHRRDAPCFHYVETEADENTTRPETIYVVCGTHEQFRSLGYATNRDSRMRYRYVYGVDMLRGIENPVVKFDGTWYNRSDIDQIQMQIRIATR